MEGMGQPFSRKQEMVTLLLSVSIISFSVLAFEVTLTRIFSVKYLYHYSFLAISLALFGLGLGGVFAQTFFTKTFKENMFTNLSLISLIFSLMISLLIIGTVGDPNPNFVADAGLMFLPFFVAGIFLSASYRVFAVHSNVLYFADLVGAAVGSLAVLFLLGHCNAVNLILLIGNVSSIGAMLLALVSRKKKIIGIAIIVFFLLAFSTQYFHTSYILDAPVASDQYKELYEVLKDPSFDAQIIDSRWSAFGRTDLVAFKKDPDLKIIFVDGGAGTRMYRFDGNFTSNSQVYQLKNSTAYFPYYFVNKNKVLIIGPGGGVDVLMALMAGTNHITAVEVNPETVNMVRDYSDYNGEIYTKYDNVHVFIDEGRGFLKRTPAKYDAIVLNIPITKTAQGVGGYSLAENYLFTIDSFSDYLDHLENRGYLVIVAHNRLELYKLTAIALEVLQARGESNQEVIRHIVATEMPHGHFPVFILKKTPFTDGEIWKIYAKSNELGFTPVYFPYINPNEFDQVLTELAKEKDKVITLLRGYGYDIGAPTDDRPFFYKFEEGMPPTLSQLLVGAIILCVVTLFLYFGAWGHRLYSARKEELQSLASKFSLFMPYYFSAIGLGFMLIEVSLIQKFILFLGHPTVAISMLLFSLLVSSGIGSLSSRKWGGESLRPTLRVFLIIGIIVISYTLLLSPLLKMFFNYDSATRFFISVTLLFPLGFFMGIPFPSGIKILERRSQTDIAWMWGLNGVFSLLGSILALAVAMSLGFSTTFLFGGLLYLIIFAFGHFKLRMEKETAEGEIERKKKGRRKRRKK